MIDRRGIESCCRCVLLLVAGTAAQSASGTDILFIDSDQDQPEVTTWNPPLPVHGHILEYTATECRYTPKGETQVTEIDVDQVAWLYQPLTRKEVRARKFFERRQYDQFVNRIDAITSTREIPDWRKQHIKMLAAYAKWDGGEFKSSLDTIGALDQQPLTPVSLSVMPIQWSGDWRGSNASEVAIAHLDHSSPAVRIVAASWLLETPHEGRAVEELRRLSKTKRNNIALLAKAVLWRNASAVTIANSADEQLATLKDMPMALRDAPSQVLANKLESAGLVEQAKRIRSGRRAIPHQVPKE